MASVRPRTRGTEVWYGDGALWKSISIPTPSAISPETESAPWVTTCASTTSSPRPSRISASPAQLIGSTEKPKSAVTSETPPRAPGSTTPGWKISKPSPAIPARKSSESTFGSIRLERKRVRKPGLASTTDAPAVCRTSPRGTVFVPSSCRRSAGRLGAIASITCRPSVYAATAVVPEPTNGSTIRSPGFVSASM